MLSVKLCKSCNFSEVGVDRSSTSFFSVVENSVLSKVGGSEAVGDELDEEVDNEYGRTDGERDKPLFPCETGTANFKDDSSGLSDKDLEADNTEPDSNEYPVIAHASENVLLVVDLASTEHVKLLEDNKGGEEESEMTRSTTGEVAGSVLVCTISHIVPNPLSVTGIAANFIIDRVTSNCEGHGFFLSPLLEEGLLSNPGPVESTSGIDVGRIRSVVSSSEMRLVDNIFTKECNDAQNDGLIDRLVHDVLDHSARDEVISSFLRVTLQ